MTLSRRNVLRGAVALSAAGAVAPFTTESADAAELSAPGTVHDCIVVGAGLSGLAAARKLTDAGRRALEAQTSEWRAFARAVESIVDAPAEAAIAPADAMADKGAVQ